MTDIGVPEAGRAVEITVAVVVPEPDSFPRLITSSLPLTEAMSAKGCQRLVSFRVGMTRSLQAVRLDGWGISASPSTSAGRSPTSASSTRTSGDVEVAQGAVDAAIRSTACSRASSSAGIDLRDVALFSHGTTVATNALITRRFPPAAMVTTEGFRDVIEIRRGTKEDLWDAYKDVAPPYIRRRDRLRGDGADRLRGRGRSSRSTRTRRAHVARVLRRRGVQTVAVCFINSYANPAHEQRMREILDEELPGVTVSTSSEVLPEIFEHERFSTTVANAVLSPLVGRLRAPARRAARRGRLRRRSAAAALRRRRDDARSAPSSFAVRLAASGHRRRRDREPPHRDALRLRERDRARHGRDEHRHLARLRGRGADHEGVVRRVRLPDLLPVDRGADDRRRRRLARLDRRGGLAAQRPAVGGRRSGPGVLRARRREADEHRREPRARPARRRADRRRR